MTIDAWQQVLGRPYTTNKLFIITLTYEIKTFEYLSMFESMIIVNLLKLYLIEN